MKSGTAPNSEVTTGSKVIGCSLTQRRPRALRTQARLTFADWCGNARNSSVQSAGTLRPTLSVSYGSFATKVGRPGHVRFAPGSDRIADVPERQFRARFGLPMSEPVILRINPPLRESASE